MHGDAPAPASSRRRLKPYQLSIILGCGIGTFTLVSGILPTITGWKNESPVHREVFGGIPGALQIAFYTVIPMMLIWGSLRFADRIRNWERGAPDDRRTTTKNVKRRLADFRAGVYMRTLLRDRGAGLMHSMIYFGFLVLLGVTTVLEIDHQMPTALKFLHGDVYRGYALVGDAAGVVFTGGVVWAILRRYVQRPYRIRIKSKPEHAWILGVMLAIGVSGFGAEMFRIASEQAAGKNVDYERWSIVGWLLAQTVNGLSLGTLQTWHQAGGCFTCSPSSRSSRCCRSRCCATSSPRRSTCICATANARSAMRAMPNLAETSLEKFGVQAIEDFTWKQLLDLDSCTMCGRCTSVCPAHATGKPLDPREIVLKSGEVMAATAAHAPGGRVSPPIGVDSEITVSANSVFERITAEEIWSCTSCKACDEICPVNIEILDKILDMRRYLSLMESNFPTELGNAYRAMENQGNPWGMNQATAPHGPTVST